MQYSNLKYIMVYIIGKLNHLVIIIYNKNSFFFFGGCCHDTERDIMFQKKYWSEPHWIAGTERVNTQ